MPPAIRARFPDEMSIILQHEFWDLVVTQEAFEVSLNFSRRPERLTIPFDAITGFSDPSVPFGFKLEPRVSEEPPATQMASGLRCESKPSPPPAPAAKPEAERPAPAAGRPGAAPDKGEQPAAAKVVSIDAFRKK